MGNKYLKGVEAIKRKLAVKMQAAEDIPMIEIGYAAPYASAVHNAPGVLKGKPRTGRRPDGTPRTGNYWDPAGEPKFLLKIGQRYGRRAAKIFRQTFRQSWNWRIALEAAGMELGRLSQEKVPVDSGELRDSMFVRVVERKN